MNLYRTLATDNELKLISYATEIQSAIDWVGIGTFYSLDDWLLENFGFCVFPFALMIYAYPTFFFEYFSTYFPFIPILSVSPCYNLE